MKSEKEEWKRTCPSCGKELFYASLKGLKAANKLNRICKVCANVGENNPNYGRPCPEHVKKIVREVNLGKVVSVETRQRRSISLRGEKNPMYGKSGHWNGKHLSYEVRKRLSELRKGKPISELHRQHISLGLLGRKHSADTKQKMRLTKIEHIKNKNGGVAPRYNKVSGEYFRQMEEKFGWNGLYATKNGEFHIQALGYFVDYYEPTRNIVVEYDEPKHYNVDNTLRAKDVDRMNEIVQHLKCQFFRYNERTGEWRQYA